MPQVLNNGIMSYLGTCPHLHLHASLLDSFPKLEVPTYEDRLRWM